MRARGVPCGPAGPKFYKTSPDASEPTLVPAERTAEDADFFSWFSIEKFRGRVRKLAKFWWGWGRRSGRWGAKVIGKESRGERLGMGWG